MSESENLTVRVSKANIIAWFRSIGIDRVCSLVRESFINSNDPFPTQIATVLKICYAVQDQLGDNLTEKERLEVIKSFHGILKSLDQETKKLLEDTGAILENSGDIEDNIFKDLW